MQIKALTFLMLGSAASAAIEIPLNDKQVIEVSISRQDLTRIAVTDDRIRNIFGITGEYVLEADEDQGQIFIRPLNPVALKSISLTLTTEGGHTQDLRLIPKDQPPEALVLHEIKDEAKKERQDMGGAITGDDITRDEVETLLLACREARIPLGYKQIPLSLNTLKGPSLLIGEIKGEKLRCLTYEVNNSKNTPLTLSEVEFTKVCSLTPHFEIRDLIAILIPQKTLNPGERTTVHVVARAN